MGLGTLKEYFPNETFPLGAVHEFICGKKEEATATSGFIAALAASLMKNNGTVLWISASRSIFPPALKSVNIQPDRFVFLDLKNEKDVLWSMDEALKCAALSAVIGELRDITFMESRRLQLAVEQSRVTGFIIRHKVNNITTTASVSRWRVSPLPSDPVDGLPGVGFPRMKVELLRMRNGKPGSWTMELQDGKFIVVAPALEMIHHRKKAG